MANLEQLNTLQEVTNVIPMDDFRRRRAERAAVQFALGMGPNPEVDDPDTTIESTFGGSMADEIREAADSTGLTPAELVIAAVSRGIEAAKLEKEGWESECSRPGSFPTVWGNIPSPFLPPEKVTFKHLRDMKPEPKPTQLHSL